MIKPSSPPDHKSTDPGDGKWMASASTMTGSVLGLGAIGYYLDNRFQWSPWGLLIGIFLGVFVGMYELYKSIFNKGSDP